MSNAPRSLFYLTRYTNGVWGSTSDSYSSQQNIQHSGFTCVSIDFLPDRAFGLQLPTTQSLMKTMCVWLTPMSTFWRPQWSTSLQVGCLSYNLGHVPEVNGGLMNLLNGHRNHKEETILTHHHDRLPGVHVSFTQASFDLLGPIRLTS